MISPARNPHQQSSQNDLQSGTIFHISHHGWEGIIVLCERKEFCYLLIKMLKSATYENDVAAKQ